MALVILAVVWPCVWPKLGMPCWWVPENQSRRLRRPEALTAELASRGVAHQPIEGFG
ncbi:MAG: hypothetical protein CM15mP74_08730 [Halieaceae bacterium]|nr:MAG: hypothetical protein CM15mP74_08730 [Halieaceae bacterium]